MKYIELVKIYEELEKNPSKIKKAEIIADFIKKQTDKDIQIVMMLVQGIVFPKFYGYELGIALQMMMKAISKSTGYDIKDIEEEFKSSGDLGNVVEKLTESRKQSLLVKKELELENVFDNLKQLAFIEGSGTQEKKLNLISELISSASPKEAKYVVRTILGDLRVGVAEGIIRDAIAKAFLDDSKDAKDAVEYAMNIYPDFGEIAIIAKKNGINGLKKMKIKIGQPVQVMLGEKVESVDEIIQKFGKIAAEFKYDGMRAQIHKDGEKIWIYTRRLENVTKQFPDLVKLCKECIKVKKCVVEGEVVGIDKKGQPMPFQTLSQRIQRKYDIEKMVKEIPIQINLFDVLVVEDEQVLDKPLLERRKILKEIVKEIPNKFVIARQIVTDSAKEIERFYKESIDSKQEGLFLKVIESKYVFGRRVGGWYKLKPTMETLDLAIIGALWGTGKRTGWMGSFILGCRDEKTGKFLECGMLGTGVKEKKSQENDVTFKELTEILKPLVISEKGGQVKIKPKVVISVDYQEIQKSPNYESGFALRFPRFISLRSDKSVEDVDSIERIKYLYKIQKKSKNK
ncbi:MAG: ATP-dependent DNA ligase [Candidatus Aenigmarchaeota archaeon]|nr:ATP-dependent DNA ligase [Candidatus Aenigmarchaeota archaeon]